MFEKYAGATLLITKGMIRVAQAVLQFDGVTMPSPKYNGVRISKNKIWSRDTGRNDFGDTVGHIIAIKRKVEISFPPLSPAQTALIDSVVSSMTPYHTIRYSDEAGTVTEMTVYFNDAVYEILGLDVNGKQINTGAEVHAIEK